MGDAVQLREQAYLDLLDRGLVLLRNLAGAGDTALCRIEADHLHNIPSLLHEGNERRHAFYIRQERELYLRRLRERGAAEYLERAATWYSGPWRVLASAAGVPMIDPKAVAERWAASVAARAVDGLLNAGLLGPPEGSDNVIAIVADEIKAIVADEIFVRLCCNDEPPTGEYDQLGPGGGGSKANNGEPV
jgi:hypothetical protein